MRVDELCAVLRSTAQGMSLRDAAPSADQVNLVERLSPRQRSVMALAATGLSTKEIARRLDSTELAVRQDLSKAYKVLVPDATEMDDLRTRAVLTYLQLTQPQEWSQS
jgi:DNA-binding NarL/FixJ family response regulator